MDFQLLLKDLEEIKKIIYENTERAEELLDHIIREVAINAVQPSVQRTGYQCSAHFVHTEHDEWGHEICSECYARR